MAALGWTAAGVMALVAIGGTLSTAAFGLLACKAHSMWRTERDARLAAEQQLDDARRRERTAVNLLADMQNFPKPFPDVDALAGSLGDQVEAWLKRSSEQ